jgi:hypothetical protein
MLVDNNEKITELLNSLKRFEDNFNNYKEETNNEFLELKKRVYCRECNGLDPFSKKYFFKHL